MITDSYQQRYSFIIGAYCLVSLCRQCIQPGLTNSDSNFECLAVMMLLFMLPTRSARTTLEQMQQLYDNTRIPNADLYDENGEVSTITDLFDVRKLW